ncbi:MAG: PRC-barrel domain-containing protein [Proteobacteria bacterium]|nr:PRC-barrel domain-containing protein [Pseudomonadota bacterium]
MKKLMLSTALAGALVIPAMVAPAVAQDVFLATPGEGDVRASEFIGKRLYAAEAAAEMDEYQGVQPDWQDIGEVNDVLLGRDGTVDAVLVDIGGFLGMGEHQVAVDMGQIKFVSDSATADDPGDYFLVMTATKADLEAAPMFESAEMTAPATEAAPAETAEAPAATETAPADAEATTETAEAPAATETAPAGTDPTAVAPVSARDGFAVAPPEQITSETLTGTAVYDAADAHVGEISELLIDADGKVTDAVVDVGGFLGIGEKPVALPLSNVEIMHSADTNQLRVFVSMTKEELEAMPAYEG